MQTFLGVPIISAGSRLGALYVADKIGAADQPLPFSPADAQMLTMLANEAAIAITTARLIAKASRRERESRALLQIGAEVSALLSTDRVIALVVDRACELFDADAAGIALGGAGHGTLYWHHFVSPDHNGESVRRINWERRLGVPTYVLATGQPLVVPDATSALPPGVEAPVLLGEGLRSELAVPLRSGDRLFGVLMVASREPRNYGDEDIELLTGLANQVAVALANAELYERARSVAERLERLIESSPDGIITFDLDGHILSWNRGAEAIYGWKAEEVIGKVLPQVPPDLMEDAETNILGPLRRGQTVSNYVTERVRKDGRRVVVAVTDAPIRNAAGEIIGAVNITKDMSLWRQMEEQERQLVLFRERDRIAMELHDGVIQSLYAVGLGLETVAQVIESDPSLALTRLAQARESVNEVIREIRNYIFGLRPDTFETRGLEAGLLALAQELKVNALIDLELDLSENVASAFSPEQAQEIFQIAREGLANVMRHASATRASLSLQLHGGQWVLVIRDNGIGFDPATMSTTGFGLSNMRERARRLGGKLSITSAPGQGTEIRVSLPAGGGP
jgi:PAS domain S-box-containing protein